MITIIYALEGSHKKVLQSNSVFVKILLVFMYEFLKIEIVNIKIMQKQLSLNDESQGIFTIFMYFHHSFSRNKIKRLLIHVLSIKIQSLN